MINYTVWLPHMLYSCLCLPVPYGNLLATGIGDRRADDTLMVRGTEEQSETAELEDERLG